MRLKVTCNHCSAINPATAIKCRSCKESGFALKSPPYTVGERCPCGGVILANTEDCKVPLCYACAVQIVKIMGGDLSEAKIFGMD